MRHRRMRIPRSHEFTDDFSVFLRHGFGGESPHPRPLVWCGWRVERDRQSYISHHTGLSTAFIQQAPHPLRGEFGAQHRGWAADVQLHQDAKPGAKDNHVSRLRCAARHSCQHIPTVSLRQSRDVPVSVPLRRRNMQDCKQHIAAAGFGGD